MSEVKAGEKHDEVATSTEFDSETCKLCHEKNYFALTAKALSPLCMWILEQQGVTHLRVSEGTWGNKRSDK